MEYYSALKRKEILTDAVTWMNLEDLMLREGIQLQDTTYYMNLYNIQNRQVYRNRK